jgi:hypothetical protein
MAVGSAPVPRASPVTAAAPFTVRPTASEGIVVLLVLMVVVFLALHGRVDGGDPRLSGDGSTGDAGRFR